jgi:hypothetical protein
MDVRIRGYFPKPKGVRGQKSFGNTELMRVKTQLLGIMRHN